MGTSWKILFYTKAESNVLETHTFDTSLGNASQYSMQKVNSTSFRLILRQAKA